MLQKQQSKTQKRLIQFQERNQLIQKVQPQKNVCNQKQYNNKILRNIYSISCMKLAQCKKVYLNDQNWLDMIRIDKNVDDNIDFLYIKECRIDNNQIQLLSNKQLIRIAIVKILMQHMCDLKQDFVTGLMQGELQSIAQCQQQTDVILGVGQCGLIKSISGQQMINDNKQGNSFIQSTKSNNNMLSQNQQQQQQQNIAGDKQNIAGDKQNINISDHTYQLQLHCDNDNKVNGFSSFYLQGQLMTKSIKQLQTVQSRDADVIVGQQQDKIVQKLYKQQELCQQQQHIVKQVCVKDDNNVQINDDNIQNNDDNCSDGSSFTITQQHDMTTRGHFNIGNRRKRTTKISFDNMTMTHKQHMLLGTKVISGLEKNIVSLPFRQPVDVQRFNIPDYLQIINQPMDLHTIKRKISSQLYQNIQQIYNDIQLIISNSMMYNEFNNDFIRLTKNFEKSYYKIRRDCERICRRLVGKGNKRVVVMGEGRQQQQQQHKQQMTINNVDNNNTHTTTTRHHIHYSVKTFGTLQFPTNQVQVSSTYKFSQLIKLAKRIKKLHPQQQIQLFRRINITNKTVVDIKLLQTRQIRSLMKQLDKMQRQREEMIYQQQKKQSSHLTNCCSNNDRDNNNSSKHVCVVKSGRCE